MQPPALAQAPALVCVRLLGVLEVRRLDGSSVAVTEWRTGKTMDLLRILALSEGRPVRAASLIDRLWPSVSAAHASGSLRTAASQVRQAVRTNCIVRHPDGLVLTRAWVDAVEFIGDAGRAHHAARKEDHLQVVVSARAAELLYGDDFNAYDDDADWVVAARDQLRHTRHEMLCDAAEAALELRFSREALGFARSAVGIDPGSESAQRSLMRSHADLGEVGAALGVYETYRRHLAEEFGADPSELTRDVYLGLLRGNPN